jgi:hypothetical protein
VAQQLLDALDPLVERLAAQVQRGGGLGGAAPVAQEHLQRVDQPAAVVAVPGDDRSDHAVGQLVQASRVGSPEELKLEAVRPRGHHRRDPGATAGTRDQPQD